MARVTRKSGSSRETILEESILLFATYGFEGVTMRQIAQAANVTLPAIYHHFGNKEELYRAVETAMFGAQSESLMRSLQTEMPAEERLRKFIQDIADGLESNSTYFKLLQRNLVEDWQQNHQFLVDMALQQVFDALKSLLNEYREGSGEGMQPIIIFSMIVGLFTMQPVTRLLHGYQYAKVGRKKKQAMLIDNIILYIKASITE